ncbi:MAG: glycosyltransferase family 87 protein [Candidatus Kerfeldbacteria bacterium]
MTISPEQRRIIQVLAAGAVLLFFVFYNAVFLLDKYSDVGYGQTDLTVFYVVGAAMTSQHGLEPAEVLDKKALRQAIMELREHRGGTQFLYPPQSAVLFVPFSITSLDAMTRAWALVNAALFLGALYVCIHYLLRDDVLKFRYTALVLALAFAPPVQGLFGTGQVNGALLFVMMGGLALIAHKNGWLAGAGFGLVAVVKVFPLFLLPYMVLKKQWKAAVAMVLVIAVLFAAAVPLFGTEKTMKTLTSVQKAVISGDLGDIKASSSLYGSFRTSIKNGEFDWIAPNSDTPRKGLAKTFRDALTWITMLVGAGAAGVLWRYRKRILPEDLLIDYSMVMLFVLLFARSTHKQYHLYILPFSLYLLCFPLTKKNIPVHILSFCTLAMTQFWNYLPVSGEQTLAGFKIMTFGLVLLFIVAFIVRLPAVQKRLDAGSFER